MASRPTSRERYSFANLPEIVEMPNLLDVQIKSFDEFLRTGMAEAFQDISPIADFHGNLRLELEYDPDDEDLFTEPKFSVEECKRLGHTYQKSILVKATFVNQSTGEIRVTKEFMRSEEHTSEL